MRDVIDLHTHTIASGDAYNTINEMIQVAAERKLEILGITEHAPAIPNACRQKYFENMKVMPRKKMGMMVLYGAELNILDCEGNVDLPDELLERLDIVIASIHPKPIFQGQAGVDCTEVYLNVMKHHPVNIIGHPDDECYPVDYKALAEGAKEYRVLLELNNASMNPGYYRCRNAEKNNKKMLQYCKELEVPIVISSDAHVDVEVGEHHHAWKLIQEIDFPEHLIANANPQILYKYFKYINLLKQERTERDLLL